MMQFLTGITGIAWPKSYNVHVYDSNDRMCVGIPE